MKKSGFILIFLILLASCKKYYVTPNEQGYVSYLIKADNHSSVSTYKSFQKQELAFVAEFDETAQYTIDDDRQADINKLFGFSDCGTHHHQNSARFGWRWLDGQLEILAYTYNEGVRNHQLITTVELDRQYSYSIKIQEDKYVFSVDDVSVVMERGCDDDGGTKYQLYPYFGGTSKAPHDILIKIQERE